MLDILSSPANNGLCAARNLGLQHLDTDAVALLDSDDIWLPDHLASVCSVYPDDHALVTPNALRWVPGQALGLRRWQDRRPVPPPPGQIKALAIENFVFVGALFGRLRALSVGGFRRLAAGCEDWDLWLRLLQDGVEAVPAKLPTAIYRLRPDSMSADDRLLDIEMVVLEDLLRRSRDPDARRGAEIGLRHRRARRALRSSYQHASREEYFEARVEAARALTGSARLLPRAATMFLAPERGIALRRRLREGGTWMTRQ